MVNKNFHIDLIKGNTSFTSETYSTLKELSVKYPYSQTIWLLLTKNAHALNDINFDDYLKKTSSIIPDRTVLYEMLYKQKVINEIKEFESDDKIIDSSLNKNQVSEIEHVEVKTENIQLDLVVTEDEVKENNEIVEINDDLSKEPLKDEQDSAKQKDADLERLEELILESALQNRAYTESDLFKEKHRDDDIGQYEKENIDINSISDNIKEQIEHEEVELIEQKEDRKFDFETDHSFLEWLSLNNSEEIIPEQNQPIEDETSRLVDEFIVKQESRREEKKDFFSPENVARLSIIDKGEFVTETLAKIYFEQQMYEKALEAYQKLSLKIPEKKSYFAIRILEIKKILTK